ncbi:MAG: protein kinase [Planctomycetota bacterium]
MSQNTPQPNGSSPYDDPALPDLVARAMELHDSQEHVNYEKLCGEKWQLIDAVRESVAASQALSRSAETSCKPRTISDRYQLESQLGAGAMGVVYRARDLELDRPVAVKILRTAMLPAAEAASRFAREAEAMAAVRHDAVASIYDRGTTDDGETYLVMELLGGLPLHSILEIAESRRERDRSDDATWIRDALQTTKAASPAALDPSYVRQSVCWIGQLAEGLHAAHEAGVVHRDIKPSNVFVRNDGAAVLLDFGIASREQHATITREGGALGTPAYMAPESLDDKAKVGRPVDVYGLCATLYHLLTLRAPYRGTPSQVLTSLAKKDPMPAVRLRPGLPRDLQAILDKGMARNPKLRYASAADLASDLHAFLNFRPVAARPVSSTTRVIRRVRRSPAFWGAVTVALVVAAFAGASIWIEQARQRQEARYEEVVASWPAGMTLLNFDNRRIDNAEERIETLRGLNAAVELSLTPLPALAYRAAFYLDQADVARCREDMATLAHKLDTSYSRAVSDRFNKMPEGSADARAVDLADLPTPQTPEDNLLAGYLSYRIFDDAKTAAYLAHDGLSDSAAAEELRIMLEGDLMATLKTSEKRLVAAQALSERIARHEGKTGRLSATAANVQASALALLRQYKGCLVVVDRALQTSPWSYTLRLNGGVAALRLGRLTKARELLSKAIELRPNYAKPRLSLFRVQLQDEDFDGAEQTAKCSAFSSSDVWSWRSQYMRGQVHSARALALADDNDTTAAVVEAKAANALFEKAATFREVPAKWAWAVSQAIADGDRTAAFQLLAYSMRSDPTHWPHIKRLAEWLPADATPQDIDAIRAYLSALSTYISRQDDF